MLIDKEGREWESVREWMDIDMCSHSCKDCPISSYNNLYGLNCYAYVKEHPLEALEEVTKAGILREEEDKEKEKIPPLCEVLRVQPYQEFIYEGIRYRITSDGERQVWDQLGRKWCWDNSCATLELMIQERDKIQIQNGVQLTEEQKEELWRVKRMLPEAKKVFLTDDGVKVRMNSLLDYRVNLNVVMPEWLDYEFEEEEK